MLERKIITENVFHMLSEIHKPLEVKLNNFISSTLKNVSK